MGQSGETGRFFAITFGFTWCLQLPAALAHLGWLPWLSLSHAAQLYTPVAALGIFGPLVAATYLTRQRHGGAGVSALFQGLLRWRVSPGLYLLALLVPGALLSAVLWGMCAAGRQGPWHYFAGSPQLITAVVVSVAEETGWRGYALPRLWARHGAFVGSCILGAIWAVWHIPMFVVMDVPMSLGLVMLLFFVGGSLFFTFLYRKSGGSLLIAVLAHVGAHLNNSHAALPADVTPLLVHTVVYAALGVATMRSAAFERNPAPARLRRVA
jgi:membrane protease YdiL (CAAX protease family)